MKETGFSLEEIKKEVKRMQGNMESGGPGGTAQPGGTMMEPGDNV